MWPWEVRWCSKGHTAGRWQSWSLETRFPASLHSSLPTAAQLLPGQEHAQAHSCTHPHCSMSFLAKPLSFWCWCCPPGRCRCGCLHPRPPQACLNFTGSKKWTTVTACGTPAGMAFRLEISRLLYLLWNRGGVGWGVSLSAKPIRTPDRTHQCTLSSLRTQEQSRCRVQMFLPPFLAWKEAQKTVGGVLNKDRPAFLLKIQHKPASWCRLSP